MRWLTECVKFHEAENSRQVWHRKMSDVQLFWSLCPEYVEFLGQRKSGAVLVESKHEEGQADKQGLYPRKRGDRVLRTYTETKHPWFRQSICRLDTNACG